VKNLKVECGGSSSINISWDSEGDGAESYVVYYKLDTDKEATEQQVPGNLSDFTIINLQSNCTYYVYVVSIGPRGTRVSSPIYKCKTQGKVPSAPNRLAFQARSPTSLQCSWGEPPYTHGRITGYEVDYKPMDTSLLETNPAVNVKIPNGAIRSLLVENILEDTTYLYAVRAENQHGWGPWQQARMKIEVTQGGDGRPGSMIFLDEDNMQQINTEVELERRLQIAGLQQQQQQQQQQQYTMNTRTINLVSQAPRPPPNYEVNTTTETTTTVTRYRTAADGTEALIDKIDYEGRLTDQQIEQLTLDCDRLEIHVSTENTTQGNWLGAEEDQEQGQILLQQQMERQHRSQQETDVTTNITDALEGDMEVTTTTRTIRTVTTEQVSETSQDTQPTHRGSSSQSITYRRS